MPPKCPDLPKNDAGKKPHCKTLKMRGMHKRLFDMWELWLSRVDPRIKVPLIEFSETGFFGDCIIFRFI